MPSYEVIELEVEFIEILDFFPGLGQEMEESKSSLENLICYPKN